MARRLIEEALPLKKSPKTPSMKRYVTLDISGRCISGLRGVRLRASRAAIIATFLSYPSDKQKRKDYCRRSVLWSLRQRSSEKG